MRRAIWTLAAMASALPLLPAPAAAQAQNGVLVIYGNDKCPTNTNGEEIVVCVRRGEEERFRIPKELRELQITPENESWAVRQQATLEANDPGIGSCSTVGPGGQSGCLTQNTSRWKAEREAQRQAEAGIPLPD